MPDFIMLMLAVLNIINHFFIFFIIYYGRRNPSSTWAWALVVMVLPYVGFIVFLCLGLDSREYRVFFEKAKMDSELYQSVFKKTMYRLANIKENPYKTFTPILDIPDSEYLNRMLHLNYISDGSILIRNNSVQLFHDGKMKFRSLLNDIENAEHFIHIQYYIMRDDNLGKALIRALSQRAAEGVEVRLLIDGMGNFRNSKTFYKPLLDAGGKIGIFMPPHFIRMNYRNHRKLCIIDGDKGYIGGFNVGEEYLGTVKRYGYWRDTHMKICGQAVIALQMRFIMDWNFSCAIDDKINDVENYLYLDKIKKNEYGTVNMQIVSSGPDTKYQSVHYSYNKMIMEAQKNIFIVTPYFVPDDSIFQSLRIAALSGVDVRIMIPANPDHPFVYGASLSYLGELIEIGVKCYQYENGFVHSKLMAIDGIVSSVGTANIDVRSFKLNFETNAFIYDISVTEEIETKFLDDLEYCTEIDEEWYKGRTRYTRIRESIGRLISPLL